MPVNQAYPSVGISAIEIQLRRGDVGIDVGTGDQIILRADFSNSATDADLRVEEVGGVLKITQSPADVERDGFGFLNDIGLGALVGQIGRIDLRLSVPPGTRRLVTTVGLGSVRVPEWTGNLQIRSGKGDVTLGKVAGQTDVKTGLGTVTVEQVSGESAVHNGMGDVTIAGGSGTVRVNAGKGSIRVRDANFILDANAGMGDVVLERVAGQSKVNSGFGQILVTEARDLILETHAGNGNLRLTGEFRSVRAKSGLGSIASQFGQLSGPVDLNTGNGDIDVILATEQALRIDASTGRGRVDSEVPLVQVGQSGPEGYFSKRVVGTAGAGEIAATVRLRSGNGNIRLRRLGDSASSGPSTRSDFTSASARATGGATSSSTITVQTHQEHVIHSDATPTPGPTRIEILQALSRGEISVEEAERQLTQK